MTSHEDRDSAPGDEEELLDGTIADMLVAAACNVRHRRQLPSALPRRLGQARDFVASVYTQEVHPLHIDSSNFESFCYL